jgi:hypothetical protein
VEGKVEAIPCRPYLQSIQPGCKDVLAGKCSGRKATILSDRILDEALRLFAPIELDAAFAGVPELAANQGSH